MNDRLSVPNEKCPHVSNDHPPACMQPPQTSCLLCPEYLDGLTDLLPRDKPTKNMRILLKLYEGRRVLYASTDPIFEKIHIKTDAIQEQLKKVREEQGR